MKAVLLFALLFAFLGTLLIPYAGLQADEMLFAGPLHGATNEAFGTRLLDHVIPLMLMSYLGALKTFVYWPLFWIRTASIYAIRLPMVLAGAITIVIFYKWAGLFAGARAALLAAVLLATDPIFLLTDTFDWGPVALQHLLVVSGCLLIARGRLSWGAFLFGLALWNKAIFAWTLAGLALAVLLVFPAAVRAILADRRRWTRALLVFALGALPLLYFNLKHPNSTLGNNAHFSFENFPLKYEELKRSIDGSGLFGFIVAPDSPESLRAPESPQGRAASWVSDRLGRREKDLMPYALLIAVPIVLLWWRAPGHRAALFAAICGGCIFLIMAITRNAGTGIHHTVLVLPMPQLLVGTVLGALPWRWLRVGLAVLLIGANLLVVNQYIAQFERNGSNGSFTDATNPLAESLAPMSGENVHFIDWGICEPVDYLLRGRPNLSESFPLLIQATPDPAQQRLIDAMLLDPHALFVDHIPALEEFPGVGAHLETIARSEGYQEIPIQTVADRNGRAIFQVFRFQPTPPIGAKRKKEEK